MGLCPCEFTARAGLHWGTAVGVCTEVHPSAAGWQSCFSNDLAEVGGDSAHAIELSLPQEWNSYSGKGTDWKLLHPHCSQIFRVHIHRELL